MAAAKDFKGLITARFFLGIFEATVGESSLPGRFMRRLSDYHSALLHHNHPDVVATT